MASARVEICGGDPDPPPVVLTLENGGIVEDWPDEDAARWTAPPFPCCPAGEDGPPGVCGPDCTCDACRGIAARSPGHD